MTTLPPSLQNWFDTRGWTVHPHQCAMLERSDLAQLLLIAPTGGGKTLAGFLPTLAELTERPRGGLHTLYISPLKALAADIRRNLLIPIEEAGLPIRVEDRTGDTSSARKRRQRADPPHILLTTPESLALLTSYEDAHRVFAGVERVIVDDVSLPFLAGAVIDFSDELIGARFVIENPNASSSCGCGTSFSM